MASMRIPVGAWAAIVETVTRDKTVAHYHDDVPEVYGTPMMIYSASGHRAAVSPAVAFVFIAVTMLSRPLVAYPLAIGIVVTDHDDRPRPVGIHDVHVHLARIVGPVDDPAAGGCRGVDARARARLGLVPRRHALDPDAALAGPRQLAGRNPEDVNGGGIAAAYFLGRGSRDEHDRRAGHTARSKQQVQVQKARANQVGGHAERCARSGAAAVTGRTRSRSILGGTSRSASRITRITPIVVGRVRSAFTDHMK